MKHASLKCPEYGCEVRPTEEEVRGMIDAGCFEKYKKFNLNTKVAKDKNLIFCSTPDCGEVLNIKEMSKKNKITCQKCNKSTCVKCKMPWHMLSDC